MKTSSNESRRIRAFTLVELLVVMGLVAGLTFFLIRGLGHGGKPASLKSAQAIMANLIGAARINAISNGRSCRILIHLDPSAQASPQRYLRYVVLQLQNADASWRTLVETYLPEDVYTVPGNFSPIPAGLFSSETSVPWRKSDNSDLRSTVLRSDRVTTEIIGGVTSEQWVGIWFSSNGTTFQSGDFILVTGRRRPPGSYGDGEAPVVLENPAHARGLKLSAYGLPVLIDSRTSF